MSQNRKEKPGKFTDVVGIEIGAGRIHLVRVVRHGGKATVMAVGELPELNLPASTTATVEQASLVVPAPFAAPYGAFAVESPLSVVRLVSLRKAPEEDEGTALGELFGATPPTDYRAGYMEIRGGTRTDPFYMACGIPEVVGRFIAGLLPDVRRPAPASLQVSAVARINAFALGPGIRHADTGIVHIQAEESLSTVTVFDGGRLVAYRQFPVGTAAVVAQVAQQFGLSNTLAAELLNENQIDPSSATTPVLAPLFRNVAMSTEFITRREGFKVTKAFLSGVTVGAGRWLPTAEAVLSMETEVWMPFDDYARSPRAIPRALVGKESHFVAALGAALALMEGE